MSQKRVLLIVSGGIAGLVIAMFNHQAGRPNDGLARIGVVVACCIGAGAVTGTIGAAVRGQPMKVLLFTVAKPFLFLMSKKDIKDVKQLKGKKIAGSSPGSRNNTRSHRAASGMRR